MAKTLVFQQITDDRFDGNILETLQERVQQIKDLLRLDGVEVSVSEPRLVEFDTNNQYRVNFEITKTTRKITWNDIYKLVNSVKAVPYKFR